MTKKTIAQSAAIVSKLENDNQQSLINNYDKVYKPLFDGLNARQKAFAEYSASKEKVNDKKKAYNECLLEHLPGVESVPAALEIKDACSRKSKRGGK